jgi:hypothetical protein
LLRRDAPILVGRVDVAVAGGRAGLGDEQVRDHAAVETRIAARAGVRVGGFVTACVRRQQRGVHAAVVARLPVSRDSSSEPESAAGATIQQPD